MKIAAAFMLVVIALLGMIVALGWVDGQFGDGPQAGSEVTGTEQAYLEFMVARLELGGTSIGNLGYLFTNAEFDNEEWRMNVFLVIKRIEGAFTNVTEIEPSERLQPFHDASVEALSHSNSFAGMVEDMVAEESTELSDEALQELVAASNAFAEAEELLLEFLDAHPLPEDLEQEELEPSLQEQG